MGSEQMCSPVVGLPQPPQFWASNPVSTQAPLQQARLGAQVETQAQKVASNFVHGVPHSLVTHAPLQQVWPGPHVDWQPFTGSQTSQGPHCFGAHVPFWQTWHGPWQVSSQKPAWLQTWHLAGSHRGWQVLVAASQ